MRSPLVVHITGDFPDSIDRNKTKVIGSLLDLTAAQFEHRALSLNRASIGLASVARDFVTSLGRPPCRVDWHDFEGGQALAYVAPGRGVLHATYLESLAAQIGERLSANPPALLVGHKLTIEGIVASKVSAMVGRPYAITVQGDTDTKILAARPDLKRLFAQVYHGAAHVFCFAPWALAQVEKRLGRRQGPTTVIPCPTELDEPIAPKSGGGELVSVFHLQSHRRKNLDGMAEAMTSLRRRGVQARLAVYGGGSAEDRSAAHKVVAASSSVRLAGVAGRGEMPGLMNKGIGFVLPSRRETFGLVFVEALFAGLPIVYPRGQAVSGYLDGAAFALPVDANDPGAIAGAMAHLINREVLLKSSLAEWQRSDDARRFQRPHIGSAFAAGLRSAIGIRPSQATLA